MTCANSAEPLGLIMENVTVSPDGKAKDWGIAIGVGTPQQILAVGPTLAIQNVFLFLSSSCSSSGNDTCLASNGGVYNSAASTTFTQTTLESWNGSHSDATSNYSSIYFNDRLHFGSSGSLQDFPLTVADPTIGMSLVSIFG